MSQESLSKEKTKDDYITDIVYDDFKIEAVIKESPQTYNTILQHLHTDGTLQQILRRRIARLKKQGRIFMARVPGTRFGVCMFLSPEHDYKVLTINTISGVRVFYMYDFEEDDKSVTLNQYWELKGKHYNKWEYSEEPYIIKRYRFRDDNFALWD